MADPLSILLNLQSTSNRTPGGGGGVPASYKPQTPLRNSARADSLAKFLGLPDSDYRQTELEEAYNEVLEQQQSVARAEAEGKAYPERVKGEYGLETARISGKATVDAARANRDAASTERSTQREFTAGQNELNRSAVDARSAATQAGINGRTASLEEGRYGRQRAGQAESRARLYETKDGSGGFKANAPRPADEGFLSKWLFGPSQEDLNNKEAARLRSEALNEQASGGESDVSGIAQQYLQQFGHLSDDELRNTIMQNEPDADPQELQQLFDAIGQMRGR